MGLRKLGIALVLTPATMSFLASPAYAADIGSSKLAEGTKKLVQDATSWMLVLAPITAVLCIIYFFIRRSAADEMDQKKWNNRIVTGHRVMRWRGGRQRHTQCSDGVFSVRLTLAMGIKHRMAP